MSGERKAGERPGRVVWNDLWGEFTAQAPARMMRGETAAECPFCADIENGVAPSGATVWIRPNDFPALNPPDGECLVLIYSRDHNRRYSELVPEEALAVVKLWHEVYERLSPTYPVVMTWETSGAEIGQTQPHPHGQTYGLAVTPDLLRREMETISQARARGAPCPFCDAVVYEASGPRAVFAGKHWVGIIPNWARYPYQVQVVARRHFSAVSGLDPTGDEAHELASVLPRIVRAWDSLYRGRMPYMLALHQLGDSAYHFHIELMPVGRAPGKLKFPASTEMAWGFWLNDSVPEQKARELRRALKEAE